MRLVIKIYGSARDVTRMVGNALEDGSDLCNRDYEAQVARSGLPERDDVNAEPVNLNFQMIYLVIIFQDGLGRFRIALDECID